MHDVRGNGDVTITSFRISQRVPCVELISRDRESNRCLGKVHWCGTLLSGPLNTTLDDRSAAWEQVKLSLSDECGLST